jgi:hypothetical protein
MWFTLDNKAIAFLFTNTNIKSSVFVSLVDFRRAEVDVSYGVDCCIHYECRGKRQDNTTDNMLPTAMLPADIRDDTYSLDTSATRTTDDLSWRVIV